MQIADGIWTAENFFTSEECVEWIEFAESLGFIDKKIISGVRTSAATDDFEKSSFLWNRAKSYLPEKLGENLAAGLNERLRFYRYDSAQKFAWHLDSPVALSDGRRSLLTFIIYLNDEYEGGETVFRNEEKTAVIPQTGMMLAFRHEIFHEGSEVTGGRKYILRSDVMFNS
jgi:hypothetical protein